MHRTLTVTVAALALVASGCEEKKDGTSLVDKAKTTVNEATKKAGDAASEMAEKAQDAAESAKGGMEDLLKGGQGALTEKLDAMLAEWKPTVEKIKGAVSSAAPDVKPQIESAVKAIEDQWKNVEGLVGKIKGASAADLKQVGTDAFSGAEKLGAMIQDAAAKFLK